MDNNRSFTEGKILQPLILFVFPVLLALFLQATPMSSALQLILCVGFMVILRKKGFFQKG